MFKNWLRQLPDEIFPKSIQAAIQQECQGEKTTPQMLKDELSKLPPFNYYLLFAITCHISLLHSCSEFNKMNYNNLCICFQPAIKIDAFCFQFLILDWRNCWQGCWTEKDYLTDEMNYLSAVAMENQAQQQTPARNVPAQNTSKSKGSQAQASPQKPVPVRSSSKDHIKNQTRNLSSDRNGRGTPPLQTTRPVVVESSGATVSRRREPSLDRAVSSSDSREGLHKQGSYARGTSSVRTQSPNGADNVETPTQARHNRDRDTMDGTQFRLDLRDPPSSPFTIKF